MAEGMAATILAGKVAEVCSQAHVGGGGPLIAPFGDWETFEEPEALAVEQSVAEGSHAGSELGKWEEVL